jgi:hypothetical protein
MIRYFDVMSDDTTFCLMCWQDTLMWWTTTQHSVWCDDTILWCNDRRYNTPSHQTECWFVAHYINLSCHHIKQSVVSSFITSTCRVITSNSVVSSLITSEYRVLTSNRVSCRRSLHQRVQHSVWCDDTILWCNERRLNILFDMLTGYFDVRNDDTTFCLMWWHDTLMLSNRVSFRCSVHQRVVSSHQTVLCRRSLYQSIVSSHQTELCRRLFYQSVASSHQTERRVVVLYINVSL